MSLLLNQNAVIKAVYKRNGEVTDPGTVEFHIKDPLASEETVYTYGVDPEINRLSTGIYTYLVNGSISGYWIAYWTGTAPVIGRGDCNFAVKTNSY